MDTVGQARGRPSDPRLSRHSPETEAGDRCSLRSCLLLALGKVRLMYEGCRERSQLWYQNREQGGSPVPAGHGDLLSPPMLFRRGKAQEKGTEEAPQEAPSDQGPAGGTHRSRRQFPEKGLRSQGRNQTATI